METILLVDDEAEVLALAREMLEGKGYRILEAPNGREALRIAAAHAEPIHLLLTDVVMPEMGGHDLAQQLGRQRPEMKVLYMSAFALVTGQQEFSSAVSGVDLEAPIILKPFTVDRLTEKVREVLAVKPPSPFDRPPDPWRNV